MTATNITFSNSSISKTVTIATKRIEYTLNNNLGAEPLAIPTTSSTITDTVKISNLLRIIERFIIDGWFATGLGDSDTNSNALDKKRDLKTIAKTRPIAGNTNTYNKMTYNDGDVEETFNITIEKMSITKDPLDINKNAPDGVIQEGIKISVVIGDPLF